MQVLIVGATGTLGRQIARRAVDAGHSVRCMVRSPRKAAFLQEWGCELTRGDLLDPASLDYALEGQEALIDAATARATDSGSAWPVDWTGKQNLFSACGRAGVRRVVFHSLLGAERHPRVPLMAIKACTEQWLEHHAPHPGAAAGREEVLLAGPVDGPGAAAVGGTGGGGVDQRLLALQGVVEAGRIQQVASRQLAAPLLEKGCFARRAHHAADAVAGIDGSPGDLASQGSRGANDQNLHPPLSSVGHGRLSLGVHPAATRSGRRSAPVGR